MSKKDVSEIVNKTGRENTIIITVNSEAPFARDLKKESGWKLESDVSIPSGKLELELLGLLEEGEDKWSLVGRSVIKVAQQKDALLGQRHAEVLFENQVAIPREWRQYCLIFPGTIWLDSAYDRYVPFLVWNWNSECWIFSFGRLGYDFLSNTRLVRPSK